MLLKRKLAPNYIGFILCWFLSIVFSIALPHRAISQDSSAFRNDDSLPFPIQDRRGDFISSNPNTYDFKLPPNINDSIAYDPVTQTYTVFEKVGDHYYRTPTTYSADEFRAMEAKKSEDNYFQERANTLSLLNRGQVMPKLNVYNNLFNRLFGNGKIDIQPQGNVDVTAGYQGQNVDNPTLPEKARKNGGFDFNMAAQLNVIANIGDKLKFPINYNTLANFGFTNQLKLNYTGTEDEILKKFEAGNVTFPLKTTLIPGAQALFGIKTQMQFGKLTVTTVLANQTSSRQSMNLQGGSAATAFSLKASDYEENRHFLLAQYFKDNYNKVMSNAPAITTPVQILRLEVWVTNKNGTTTNARSIVGLMDLGENHPYHNFTVTGTLPDNRTNNEYSTIISNPNARSSSLINTQLMNMGLNPVQDYEQTFARKLDTTQYYYNPRVGFISLSQPLQPDEVLAVAYQYSYNGKIYQVGEFSQDVPPDSTTSNQKVLFLKLLKATSQLPNLPIWGLMMKNVYSVGYGTLDRQNFQMNVLYQQPGLGAKRYLPFGDLNKGTPILTLENLDRLNSQNDPQPDGVFDYIEGYTVLSQYSRIIFPLLQPFGRDIAQKVFSNVSQAADSLYYPLYDSIKSTAQQQFPNLDRFVLSGTAKTTGSSDINIGYNIPPGSVTVTAGGQQLRENIDYTINYDLGTIKVINQAIINSGVPVQVNYENNATSGLQQKSYLGLRLDYILKNNAKEQLTLGGTMVRLSERPFFTKVNYGDDPIRNTMYGLDGSYRRDMPRITKILNKLPFFNSTAPSSLNAYGESAFLKPGHAPQIGKGNNGAIYIDDFDGSQSNIDLRFPPISWALASTPHGATDKNGNLLFPEADSSNSLVYGMNRAQLSWYQIEPTLQDPKNPNNPLQGNNAVLSDPRMEAIPQTSLFPQATPDFGQQQLVTFDISYFPSDRGPYNYTTSKSQLNANGKFLLPQTKWGGLMRSLDQTDFETANIEYIECWVQDPFINDPSSTGGQFYIDLGDVSEDILKDGQRFYENGLPTPNLPAQVDTTIWGVVPRNPIQVTNAFSNNPGDRPYQDVGFDGLTDSAEVIFRRNDYLNVLASNYGSNSQVYLNALSDPSSDNYQYYRGANLDAEKADIIERYKKYNNPQGNSPIADNTSQYSTAATLYPDQEDLNGDNTLNQTESYFQYMVDLKPPTDPEMTVGNNFIIDKKVIAVPILGSTTPRSETWYQLRIPITSYNNRIGSIPDFKSIRFIRMFLTGFQDSVTLRFGELSLVRNTWRKFQYRIDSTGNYTAASDTSFDVGTVNIEEDDKRTPLPYQTPAAIQRVQSLSNNGVPILQNEQSLTLKFCSLAKNDGKAVFQTYPNRDLRQFRQLQMYIHAERDPASVLNNNDLTAVIRIGSDFVNNYYEVRIPLALTPLDFNPLSASYNDTLWIQSNSLNLDLGNLITLKTQRDLSSSPLNSLFSKLEPNGQTYSIIGNPNLGQVSGILLGVVNTGSTSACGQLWFDELRLTSMNEKGGWASLARVDANLADLGTISAAANTHSFGFGTLDQGVTQRDTDNFVQFDVAANLELGKLLPKKAAMSIPFYASVTKNISTPEYDPLEGDITYKQKLKDSPKSKRDSIKNSSIDYSSIKTISFTNVHKNRTGNKKPHLWDIENIDVSYTYTKTEAHNPIIEYNNVTRQQGSLGYNFMPRPKFISPFKKIFKKTKNHWFDLIKDFNINPIPSQLTFKADIFRQFAVLRSRSIGGDQYVSPETYDNNFTFNRNYILRWELTHSLTLDYSALNNAVVDQPFGRLDTKSKRDTAWHNLFAGGRNILYNQTVNLTYNVPLSKFPLTDWMNLHLDYTATYSWIGASRLAVGLGNFLENGQQENATLQMDFVRLYNKSKWLRALDQPIKRQENNSSRDTSHTKKPTLQMPKNAKKASDLPEVTGALRVLGKLITSVKSVNATFADNSNTRLPGYTDSTRFLGQDFHSMAPGFGFIMGRQPDTTWLNNAAKRGLITKDSLFNDLFTQNYNQAITVSVQLQPVRDMTIDLNIGKTFSKNYSETFKDTTGTGNHFGHLSPYVNGNFNVTYIAFNTLFGKYDPNRISQTFIKFQDYRQILSQRLGAQNVYNKQAGSPTGADGYSLGYGRYAVDVLVPAFVAAYTGQDPNKVALIKEQNTNIKSNPFSGILPKPNWRFTYNGLSKIPLLGKIFTNFSITHAYNASLSMNNFTSALDYQDVSHYDYPSFIDTVSKNYIPFFLVPNVTIQEQFAPLVGLDMTFTNQLSLKFDYTKQRQLSLSLIDYQLSEVRSSQITFGGSYKKKGIKLPFKVPFTKTDTKKLDNEMNFTLNLSLRNNVTSNSILDQNSAFATAGSKEIMISPTLSYYINNRVNVQLYFTQDRVIPYISSSAPTTNTRAGVQVRISLSPPPKTVSASLRTPK